MVKNVQAYEKCLINSKNIAVLIKIKKKKKSKILNSQTPHMKEKYYL